MSLSGVARQLSQRERHWERTSQSASQTAPLIGKTPSGRREMSRIATEGGRPLAGRASPAVRLGSNWAQGSGPCSHWKRLRNYALPKSAGQAVVNRDSGARSFPIVENFARPARPPPTRQWLPYQGSWREAPERLYQRKSPSLKTVCRAQRCLNAHPKSTSPVSCIFFALLLL